MAAETQESNILKFRKRRHMNIGIIIFGIIFIYLIATIVMYLTAPHVTVYEVRQGSILKDTAYTGLAIRDEIVVQADADGYLNYYVPDGSKVKNGSKVYTLSNQELSFAEDTAENEISLTSEEQRSIMLKIQQFQHDYQDTNFSDTYRIKEELGDSLRSLCNQSKSDQLEAFLAQEGQMGISVYKAARDGIVVYATDGMENLTVETATLADLDKSGYQKTEYANNAQIRSGEAVYKIVTSDTWTLMLELTEETAGVLQDKKYVKVNFTKDDQMVSAT